MTRILAPMRASDRGNTAAEVDLRIGDVTVTERDGRHRVQADVAGHELWFEAQGRALSPSAEAFASALLVPALHAGVPLVSESPLSRAWITGATQIMQVFGAWWGYAPVPVVAPVREEGAEGTATRSSRAALCFSGGVDSFFSLLRSGLRIDLLASVHGFDVPLGDRARWDAFEPSLRDVAATTGKGAVVVRTNLREHPWVAACDWERSHGGALAAVGHLLAPGVGRLIVSSSIARQRPKPWGSHWQTDPLWSSPALEVFSWGEGYHREEKVRAVCREVLVERHLRVCWENLAPTGNCSRCVKCLRTSLVLLDEGVLDRFPGFAPVGEIPAILDSLPSAGGRWRVFVRLLRKGTLPPDVHRALYELKRRTWAVRRGPFSRLRRLLRRWVP